MTNTPIVSTEWLAEHLDDPGQRIVDVRWKLGDPGAGRRAFEASRIPGALFLDIDDDLSSVNEPGHSAALGRHPLPSPARLVEKLSAAGIGRGNSVVAYDDASGAHAARLWWLLRWLGVENVAVLDGGWSAWVAEDRPIETGAPRLAEPATERLEPRGDGRLVVDKVFVESRPNEITLIDARAPERYRGELEPIDPRPGHIPGARNVPTSDNLRNGRFRSPEELRERYAKAGVTDGKNVVAYCGSGVTACHDLLALELAGITGARLYAGSYSEWANDPALPVATGESSNR